MFEAELYSVYLDRLYESGIPFMLGEDGTVHCENAEDSFKASQMFTDLVRDNGGIPVLYKRDLIDHYAQHANITKVEAEKRMTDIFNIVVGNLAVGYDIKISHFFNFYHKILAEKKGKNPYSKEDMIIPETKTINIRMTKTVKDLIQRKE